MVSSSGDKLSSPIDHFAGCNKFELLNKRVVLVGYLSCLHWAISQQIVLVPFKKKWKNVESGKWKNAKKTPIRH